MQTNDKRRQSAMKRQRGRGRKSGHQNNNRSLDSNGPNVKIRGTASQISEKYQALARDANLSGDRIAAENFMQHAEHYYRLVRAAQANAAQNAAANAAPAKNTESGEAKGQNPEAPEGEAQTAEPAGTSAQQVRETPGTETGSTRRPPRTRRRRPADRNAANGKSRDHEDNGQTAEGASAGEPAEPAPVTDEVSA